MQHLGHADAVEDVDAEVAGPALVERGRQRLAGADAASRTPASASAGSSRAQHVGEERRAGEEQRRAVLLAALDQRVRPGRRRLQHRGRADRQREQQRVAQPVGEERLGRGQAAVVRADPAAPAAPYVSQTTCDRAVPVHGRLRRAGGAGGVEPERRRVGVGRRTTVVVAAPASSSERVHRQRASAPVRRRGSRAAPGRTPRRPRRASANSGADREQPGPGVAQQLGQAVGAQHGRDRHRHRADPHRGQVDHDELRRVRHEHQHPLLGLQAEAAQAGGGADDPLVQLGVGDVAGRRRSARAGRPSPAAMRRSSR